MPAKKPFFVFFRAQIIVAAALLFSSPGVLAGSAGTNDPIYSAIASCVSVPASSESGSGTNTAAGCQINGCPSSAALNITTWLPWFCDKNPNTAYPSESWSACVRWFFTGRWEGLVSQVAGALNTSNAPADCPFYNNAVATIRGEWTCLSGSLKQASGGRSVLTSMQKDVDFITSSLGTEGSTCAGLATTSSSSSSGTSSSVVSFGGNSSVSSTSSSGATAANQRAISLIGFDTGSPTLNAALSAGVRGQISGCGFDGSGANCDRKSYDEFQSFTQSADGVSFPVIYPGSQAAYDLGLPTQTSAKGGPVTVSGQSYIYCSSDGYWAHGTTCPASPKTN